MSKSERGFTLIELLIVVGLVGVLAALTIHHVLAARAVSNEASAIGTLRALNSAQTAYSNSCAQGYYATSFARLVTGRFASPDMNLSPKSGYFFVLTAGTGGTGPNDCDANATQGAYYATGSPTSPMNGQRAFSTNQASTIWQDTTGTPPAEPFAITATVAPLQMRQ